MKRIVSMLLAVCMCLSVGVMLTACGDEEHTHTYKTEWSKDTTHHWHACESGDCADITDKAEHTWNEGEITTPATAEADGVKTFACTVCGQTKTEPVKLQTQVDDSAWTKAFEALNNCEIKTVQDMYVLSENEWILSQENYRIEDYVITSDGYLRSSEWNDTIYTSHNNVHYEYYISHMNTNPVWERKTIDEIPPITGFGPIVVLSQTESKFNEFSYDEETKMYVASNVVYYDVTEDAELTFENVFIKFENDKITSFSYVAIVNVNEHTFKQVIKFSFDKYGIAALDIPSDYTEVSNIS